MTCWYDRGRVLEWASKLLCRPTPQPPPPSRKPPKYLSGVETTVSGQFQVRFRGDIKSTKGGWCNCCFQLSIVWNLRGAREANSYSTGGTRAHGLVFHASLTSSEGKSTGKGKGKQNLGDRERAAADRGGRGCTVYLEADG